METTSMKNFIKTYDKKALKSKLIWEEIQKAKLG